MWHIPSIEKYRFCVESPDGLEEIPFPLSTARILERADELGVRWRAIPYTHLIELQYCNETHVFHYQIPSSTTELGFYACLDKGVSQSLLRQAGLSVASGFKVLPAHTTKQMRKCFDQLQKPLVVKPSHGYQGRGVFMHIMTFEEMVAAIMSHRSLPLNEDEGSMVEETLQGKEHRLVVSRGRV
jgi:biotin carboxylase